MKLEVVVVPVSDVDRAKDFYKTLGWREDADFLIAEDYRVVQLTPPGSGASIIFGLGVTSSPPGSLQELMLVVNDLDEARNDLLGRGVDVSDVFHDETGSFHHGAGAARVTGRNPAKTDYGSFASFDDPDGNGWILQEVKVRAPGR